jgi:UV DNA damage repair endonuclease
MLRRLGYACMCLSVEDSSPRGTILLSSDIVPLGSHPVNGLAWCEEFAEPLTEIGELIRHESVESAEFAQFLALARDEVEFDCMLEAKAKDLALFRLRDALGIGA